jgi:hypothetical protein
MGDFDYDVECPYCGAVFSVPRIRAGRQEQCPVCRATVLVADEPRSGEEAVEEEPGFPDEEMTRPGAPVPDDAGRVCVCCAREQKVNPIAIGPLLATFTGVDEAEGRRRVVRSGGLLAEGLQADTARNLLAALAEEGVEAFAVPTSWLPEPHQLRMTRVYGADPEALRIQTDVQGTVKAVPWSRLAVGLCVQTQPAVVSTTELRMEETFSPAGMGGLAPSGQLVYRARPAESLEPVVTLVLAGKGRVAYMLVFGEEQVRYAYLAERVRPGRAQNLSLLLGDLLRWGRRAFFPATFRAAAEGKPLRVRKVRTNLAMSNYLRWALCCAVSRGLFRAG